MKIRETNWGWGSGKETYFKLSSSTCLSLRSSTLHTSYLEYKRGTMSTFFILPKEFVTNDST